MRPVTACVGCRVPATQRGQPSYSRSPDISTTCFELDGRECFWPITKNTARDLRFQKQGWCLSLDAIKGQDVLLGDDGDPTKVKDTDGQSVLDGAVTDDGGEPLDGSASSRSSSRSSTSETSRASNFPSQEDTPSLSTHMDYGGVAECAVPMDISAPYVPNTEPVEGDDDSEEVTGQLSSVPPEDDDDDEEDGPLDFSLKKTVDRKVVEDVSDLSRSTASATHNGLSPEPQDSPLDLTVPRRRKEASDCPRKAKVAKLDTPLPPQPSSPWGYCSLRQAPAGGSSKVPVDMPVWNGKVKTERHSSSKHHHSSLLTRSSVYSLLHSKTAVSPPLTTAPLPPTTDKVLGSDGSRKSAHHKSESFRPGGRHNPWQSQWMTRSGEQTKDVFTCVWCKESFRSLAEMTVHMKHSPRCGMAGMQSSAPTNSPSSSSSQQQQHPAHSPLSSPKCSTSSSSGTSGSGVVKENVTLPRKLVRGQDVWLGKGAEQTRQILKCMWCGQSFKSLADMTTHMRVTQHYTNIISQEQIISWRTPEDKLASQSQVNAVLTCKVCDQAFGSLKELSYHMVKNSHYKEHILRSITEGSGRRRQTRERRKKSLPVRKLLELERMEVHKQTQPGPNDLTNSAKSEVVDGKISCEECTEKVDAKDFVQHIKNCGQGARAHRVALKSPPGGQQDASAKGGSALKGAVISGAVPPTIRSPTSSQDAHQEDGKSSAGPLQAQQEEGLCGGDGAVANAGSTSVLNAIERLIEKSFESKGRRGNSVSTGILQRLGIDEEVYPPWHPSSSPNPFGVIRSSADLALKAGSSLASIMNSGRAPDFKDCAEFSGSESRSRSSSTSDRHQNFDDPAGRLSFCKDTANRVSTPSSASQSCSPVQFLPESPPPEDRSIFSRDGTPGAGGGGGGGGGDGISSSSPLPPPQQTISDSPSLQDEQQALEDNSERISAVAEESKADNADVSMETAPDEKQQESPASNHPIDCSSRSRSDSGDRSSPAKNKVVGSKCDYEAGRPNLPKNEDGGDVTNEESSNKRRSPASPHQMLRRNMDTSGEMVENASAGSPMSTHSTDLPPRKSKETPSSSSSSTASDHPLKELQKLLDKTDAHLSRPTLPATPGSILAFSWACNEATTSDSLMKCAFCETHFISKGAYRHHLSKMHFVKDGNMAEAVAWKGDGTKSVVSGNGVGSSSSSNSLAMDNTLVQAKEAPNVTVEESPHSKFLKYTELAKQLSSKYV